MTAEFLCGTVLGTIFGIGLWLLLRFLVCGGNPFRG